MSISLGELAVRFGCELRGDPELQVDSVATLGNAHQGALAFLANPLYREQLAGTQATAVVLDAGSANQCPVASLVATNPYATYARVARLLSIHCRPRLPGIHPSAVVSADAQVDPTAQVAALAVIGAGCTVGRARHYRAAVRDRSECHAGSGRASAARVTLCRDVQVGARSLIQPGAVIGGDGFGFAQDDGAWLKVPQVGTVRIGADVEIGANTTIDRGAIDDTVIEDGVKLDNQIQIGHNVHVGAHTAIAACVGISGSITHRQALHDRRRGRNRRPL